MKDEAKNKLGQILGAYDEKLAEIDRREAASRAAQAAFPERFATLRTRTIRPVIEEFADVLNGRGHQATAREQEESSSTVGGVLSAAISLRIIPRPFVHKSTDTNKSFIEITFSANRNERKITVSSTNTMTASVGNLGKRGEYELDAVTADVVAEHVLQILQEALAPAR
ncbi:MAG TPA: hypothetical protein VIF15_19240 [Polyangiaceae bacterium]|jgi:hypothetical protein